MARHNFNINILQWNAQSLKPKIPSFEILLNRDKIHLAVVSETWMDPSSHMNLPGYKIFRQDRSDGYGGVAIICHNSLQTFRISCPVSNSGIEIIAIKILNCKLIHNIVSIYCPSSIRTVQSDWDGIFSQFSTNTLIAGDFNAHHHNWSNRNDTRGSQIFDSSLDNNFFLLNTGKVTRVKFVNNTLQETSPDITFCSADIAVNTEWDVTNESLGSDHLMIKLSIKYKDYLQFTLKRNLKSANWSKYKDIVENLFTQCTGTFGSVQEMYDCFMKNINQAVDQSIPFNKICNNPSRNFIPKSYWSPELSRIIGHRRLALKCFRRNPTPQNLSCLNLLISKAQRMIRQAKSRSFQNFCNSINESTSLSDMWRKMRWIKGFKQTKSYTSDLAKEELLSSLTPDFVTDPSWTFSSNNPKLDIDFTLHEMENCFKRNDTSPGHDEIYYSMLYNLPDTGKKFLLNLYNFIYRSGCIPTQWRKIQIVPISKFDQNSKLRPIALISCLCKIFHLMLAKRLEWFIEYNKILSPNTVGFRRGLSCLDSLVRLVSSVQIGFSQNIPTIACFLDIEGAYNNVSVGKVISILDELNIGKKMCSYLWEFLKERHLQIKCEESKKVLIRWTNKGLSQGDIPYHLYYLTLPPLRFVNR
ncbi:unnamed protein product [Euphydryas editha]|uniref:Reverse transcriptase domain-containing protein n=1 Tax=Euphydryas editha TaxID=104508 RepID=A0AAU9TXY2_EUPED|nr:unnamed protein product [Euphydryas editha]